MLIINQPLGIQNCTWFLRSNDNSFTKWRGGNDVKRQRVMMTSRQTINKTWVAIMLI